MYYGTLPFHYIYITLNGVYTVVLISTLMVMKTMMTARGRDPAEPLTVTRKPGHPSRRPGRGCWRGYWRRSRGSVTASGRTPSTKVEMVHSMHACLLVFVSCWNLLLHIPNVFEPHVLNNFSLRHKTIKTVCYGNTCTHVHFLLVFMYLWEK